MKLLDNIARSLGFQRIPAKRMYAAAQATRLTEDWTTNLSSADTEVWSSRRKLRARSRQLERDNPFIERYFKLLENNVLGDCGIGLQMKIRDPDKFQGEKVVKGKYDTLANQTIEAAWYEWGRKGVCTVDGKTSWTELQRLVLRSVARDGECFIIKEQGGSFNRFKFALKFLEADYLREDYNTTLPGGNIIKMGVEMTPDGYVVGYHFYTRHPYEYGFIGDGQMRFVRIPADRVLHVFRPTRAGQTTGVPWISPAMMTIKQLDGYWEAELVAARSAASKMGFYEKQLPVDYQGQTDAQNNATQEMQPGVIEDLPMGVTFKTHDPQHPVTAFSDFVKSVLRGASSGLGVSYNSLANDLEGVNYSSIRAGLLEERSEWKAVQNWMIECLHEPLFEEWLSTSLLAGALRMPNGSALPAVKFDKFHAPEWKPRRWPWVDPLKDLQAKVMAIEKGLDSRSSTVAEQGGDIESLFADISSDDALADAYGLKFTDENLEAQPDGDEDGEEKAEQDNGEDSPLPASDNVQMQALNGAQLQSITEVLQGVSSGTLSPDAALILIQIALPTADKVAINEMIAAASKFKPKPFISPTKEKT